MTQANESTTPLRGWSPAAASRPRPGDDAITQLLEKWEARSRGANPCDAMLINKHIRELREAVQPQAQGACGNEECGWSGSLADCVNCGSIGPLCPRCSETVEPQGAGVIRYRKHYPSGPDDGTRRLGGWSYIDACQAPFYVAALAGADCVEHFEPIANPQAAHPAPKQAEPPPIDYKQLIRDCYATTQHAQGTPGCKAFARGAEWYREQVTAPTPPKGAKS